MAEGIHEELEPDIPQEAPQETTQEAPQETQADIQDIQPPQEDISSNLQKALNQERAQARQMRAEMENLRNQVGQFQGLREQLDEYRLQQSQQQEQDNFETDPLGTIRKEIQDIKQARQNDINTVMQAQQQHQYEQQMHQNIQQQADQFASQTPDYHDALNYWLESRANEWRIHGTPENYIPQLIEQELGNISDHSEKTGASLPAQLYEMAKLRGYRKTAAKPDKIQQIDKGQKASQTLTDTPGTEEGVNLQDVTRMSDDEFDALWAEMERSEKSY